jgi:ubiquinone/menaquinone biosynthesis C-methylase UbiE
MPVARVPLSQEPIDGAETVVDYDRYAALFMKPEYRLTVNMIRRCGITHGRVLDIGTGSGRLANVLVAAEDCDWQVTGLDLSPGMLKQAHVNAASAFHGKNVAYVQATATKLPFPDNAFDVVTSYASLHHWKEPTKVFDEIWRVTKSGGLILVRDNRRMIGNPLYRAGVAMLSLFMSSEQRQMWPKSILASYTLEEIKELLSSTRLSKAQVRADMAGFDLCIQIRKTGS